VYLRYNVNIIEDIESSEFIAGIEGDCDEIEDQLHIEWTVNLQGNHLQQISR